MLPIIVLGMQVGMGALAGHKLALRTMRPKTKTLGQLPPVNVVGLGDIRVPIRVPLAKQPNFANGLHFYNAALTLYKRGDYANADRQIRAAIVASGAISPPFAPPSKASVLSLISWYHTNYLGQLYAGIGVR